MLFRSSMLVNGMLCSIEAVYGLKNSHIEQLEKCDKNINEVSRTYLIGLKEKHSKPSGLIYSNSMQGYLTSPRINEQMEQLFFQLRTRMYDWKANYKNFYGSNLACLICKEEDSQSHLLQCEETTAGVDLEWSHHLDIFGSLDKVTSKRNIILKKTWKKKSSSLGSLVHPCRCLICIFINLCILWIEYINIWPPAGQSSWPLGEEEGWQR